MVFLSFIYRFLSNFAFMAVVYFSLNFMEKYEHRAGIAGSVASVAGMSSGGDHGRLLASGATTSA